MARALAASLRRMTRRHSVDESAVLTALASPVLVVDAGNMLLYVNDAAEEFFRLSANQMLSQPLYDLIPADSPLFFLLSQVRAHGNSMADHGVTLETPRIGMHEVTLEVAPINDSDGQVAICIHERSVALQFQQQLTFRGAARSVTAMAAMLAHEVKNPLSGIRGAAQLLEQSVEDPADQELTTLIREETDRICALVDRMEAFTDQRPLARGPVNIHLVLDHVRKVAKTGFARQHRFVEQYDPSLPSVLGNRDMLIQVFLNLVKNASEALPEEGGEIILSTAYKHGIRLALPGTRGRFDLPLVISIIDNGPGIADDLRQNLFDPFVTTKQNGSGLGLSLVAKLVGDHGGIIEVDSQPRRTTFRVMLPMATTSAAMDPLPESEIE
ncbi:MAG: PAS domain-containing protein [Alphaproteobacteria bacterium]|nr:PAS domain-containing protein [Alphaproteobacteria bacterium]MBU0797047.1 PAS domain-containing protein [Alphaproteobacteria bacterium]MBU0887855.1 PAS domain-containing protein [Alphaproteobacteria bacterium]MBU1814922.1 PAS domain-containing protein [Alphaproteobacteria bacterium]